ncbi:hypothetical protein [Sinomonas gamaensis]|uniref:hypothetical protein n=1 Tax=Sinomonas gamaensis TaxID=2565624 RepID=UPI0011090A28|nr:hypothetical protein [Sinomonas gamaensis]
MGATNVAQVFTYWTPLLKPREALALAYMALISKDTDSPSVYWGGWQKIAQAIGLDPEAKYSDELVRRAVAKLVKVGAIVPSGRARVGIRAEYALALDPRTTWAPTLGKGREVSWTPLEREPSQTVGAQPKEPSQSVGAPSAQPVRAQPPRSVRESPHQPSGPRSTQEPQEEYGEDHKQSPKAVRSPVRAETIANQGVIEGELVEDEQPAVAPTLSELFQPMKPPSETMLCSDCLRHRYRDEMTRVDVGRWVCSKCREAA